MHPSPETWHAIELWLVSSAINVLAAILILIAGYLLSHCASRWTRRGLSRLPHFDETLKPLLASLVRYSILIAAVIKDRFHAEGVVRPARRQTVTARAETEPPGRQQPARTH